MEATISTQNGYVATLCDRNYLHDFVRPKNGLLRPLRFKMDMLRLSRTKSVMMRIMGMLRLCGIEVVFVRNCATQKRYVATIATQNGNFANLPNRRVFVRPCATQMGSVAIMCGSKEICCNCSTEKIMLQVLRLEMSMLGLCRTKEKFYNFALPKKIYFATLCKRNFPCDLSASKQICCDFECTKKVCATNPTSQQNRFVAMLLDRLAICN